MFKGIIIEEWRQFEKIDIEFHPRLTILTGANGSGKTTILNLLNKHFGWAINFVSTPERDNEKGILRYLTGLFGNILLKKKSGTVGTIIGNILYENGDKSNIVIPENVSSVYTPQLSTKNNTIRGLYIPSHRAIFTHRNLTTIPTKLITREQIFNAYTSFSKSRYTSDTLTSNTPTLLIKETLISLATFGYGNNIVTPNKNAIKMYEDFQNILKIMLPDSLGFENFSIEVPEVVLITKSGKFSIDAVSGGIAAIIDLAWQIFMFDEQDTRFVVLIDEPENHLYPEMQRSMLSNLLKAFPNVQFIISTHNPFIVSSVSDSNVYVLKYNDSNKVFSIKLDSVNKAGSSNDILREVLGVPTTIPIWVETKLSDIINRFSSIEITEENLLKMRKEMAEIGLEKIIPETISKVVEKKENK